MWMAAWTRRATRQNDGELSPGLAQRAATQTLHETAQPCSSFRKVGDIPENKRDDLLGRHFAGTQRVVARPQPVKVEADDIAALERLREQADPRSVTRLTHRDAVPQPLASAFVVAARYRGERRFKVLFQQRQSRRPGRVNRPRTSSVDPPGIVSIAGGDWTVAHPCLSSTQNKQELRECRPTGKTQKRSRS